MNPQTFTVSPRNATAVTQYAELAGVSPQEFLNRFLEKFLVEDFDDPQIGAAEPFMLGFEFKDYTTALRCSTWIKQRDPDLEIEILQSKEGFKVRATYLFDGRRQEI